MRSTVVERLVRSPWPRPVLLVVLLVAAVALALTNGLDAVDAAKAWVADLGVLGPVAFVVLCAVATMGFLPVSVLCAVSGLLFGPVLGVPVVWTGAVLGAAGSFLVGRGLSKDAVERLAGKRMASVNALLDRYGAATVFVLRLLPLGPFALLNYVLAVTSLPLRAFLLGTGAGIVPGVVVYTALGGTAEDPSSPVFLLSVGALVAMTVVGAVVARRVAKRTPVVEPAPQEIA
ncbi:TVP38/TMEM64 family protein [Umezawaea endophytica]|uniref:TVP38/TMEM64 family membrane protein n=1 Tax=Umezawaea endophytica TaxID=1654476 RepID=A0A9X2VPZ7_9PSEU|nr:TVP38/TMEM64 family protein [Umezawaea endophytica]MCS7479318.1 TVP38/TMEM64 family protein [Umezawaea endophytica]